MKPHLLIMAAGTGGHIMPGLAIAQEAKARGWSVSWLALEACVVKVSYTVSKGYGFLQQGSSHAYA
jgi:UDP-N-acetylglucosamine:LPS N-acetylglucosamine transferase